MCLTQSLGGTCTPKRDVHGHYVATHTFSTYNNLEQPNGPQVEKPSAAPVFHNHSLCVL
jgi:hypothetical protein